MKILLLLTSLFLMSFCNNHDTKPNAEIQAPSVNTQTKIDAEPIVLTVFKDPNCGCCAKWIDHLDKHNFNTETIDTNNLDAIKLSHNIPKKYQSCHTGISQAGYFFEGHVPAKYIKQFLQEKPQGALGLTVPSMPVGTPGMEMGSKFMPYKIFMLMQNEEVEIYADIKTMEQQF